MAANKNSLIRYRILDQCFRNPGKRFFMEDLIDACSQVMTERDPKFEGISRRQIFEDIRFMESADGWNIELLRHKDKKRVFYRYENLTFSINNMPLNEVEINQLKSAIDTLGQFKGMPHFDWLQTLMPKLQEGMGKQPGSKVIVGFDTNEYLKGIEYLAPLYNAVNYERVLRVMYKPFEDEVASEIIFHPYYLRQYNNRWFAYGFNPNTGKLDWNLALDRIESIMEIQLLYQKNIDVDWTEYFEDIIGVTKPIDGKVEKIKLLFLGRSGKYMFSKPIHGSQKAKWLNEQTLEVTLELIINFELERLILSYCDSVKVLEPPSLVEKIFSRVEAAHKLQSTGDNII